MRNPGDSVDDPADAFEYDEQGCLVEFTPKAFDHFMLAMAGSGRVREVRERLRRYQERFQAASIDPYIEGQRIALNRLLVSSEERLQEPITQLALMRLAHKCERAVQRFNDERSEERRVGAWLEF